MRLNNTTDIPSQLIAIAVAHSIEAGVEIDEITVKNKKAGKVLGQWGWYFPTERRIVIIVPQVVHYTLVSRMPFSKVKIKLTSRADFLIAIMAHELRHAWQFQVSSGWSGQDRKQASEIDAEAYELRQLNKWRERTTIPAAASRG